jgi:hypothetical protein
MRDADGFLTRESWEHDFRVASGQMAVEKAEADGSLVVPPCLEEVETAFKRSHRGRNRTEEAWRQEVDRSRAAFETYINAQNKISDQAHSQPITEDDWQEELKRRAAFSLRLVSLGEARGKE